MIRLTWGPQRGQVRRDRQWDGVGEGSVFCGDGVSVWEDGTRGTSPAGGHR